jgi:glycosyltransferase involved in cell wall biosynthesis
MKEIKIICFGPGPKFKGGISNYNTSLAKALDKMPGTKVEIVSWTNQYPGIIPREFVDTKSKKDFLEGTGITVSYLTNYNKPLSWKKTADYIIEQNPDIVIFQWAIALQGLPMGWIASQLKKKCGAEIIFDLHFVIQKEGSKLDNRFTRMGIKHAHTYITHAYKTVDELKELFPSKKFAVNESGERKPDGRDQVIKLYHPIYDLFEPKSDFDTAAFKQENGLRKHVFLFFGFIRKYKGLHFTIEAFAKLAKERDDVSLMICGESFWNTLDSKKLSTKLKKQLFGVARNVLMKKKEDEQDYQPLTLIDYFGIQDRVLLVNEFIPNEDVHKYFQAADAVVLFYEYATPSGIESLSYNFQKPLLATKVGHFPETIEDGYNGYLAEAADVKDMKRVMEKSITNPLPPENVAEKTKDMSWENYAEAILKAYR